MILKSFPSLLKYLCVTLLLYFPFLCFFDRILQTGCDGGNQFYVVASKCSRNHFISEKYVTVQSFKIHFFQNSTFCNYTLSSVNVKMLETLVKAVL